MYTSEQEHCARRLQSSDSLRRYSRKSCSSKGKIDVSFILPLVFTIILALACTTPGYRRSSRALASGTNGIVTGLFFKRALFSPIEASFSGAERMRRAADGGSGPLNLLRLTICYFRVFPVLRARIYEQNYCIAVPYDVRLVAEVAMSGTEQVISARCLAARLALSATTRC